jgi:hypothetical protein
MSLLTPPFYVTLVSDACLEQYPKNNASDWTTRLKMPLNLQGKWECAVVEINYINSIYNIPTEQRLLCKFFEESSVSFRARATAESNSLKKAVKDGVAPSQLPKAQFKLLESKLTIPAGLYSPNDIITCIRHQIPRINVSLTESVPAFEISVGEGERRTSIDFQTLQAWLEFPPESELLQIMLGFTTSTISPIGSRWYRRMVGPGDETAIKAQLMEAYHNNPNLLLQNKKFQILSKKPINVALGKQMLYIYSDVCDYSYVGDATAQLLRVVTIKGDPFQIVAEIFDSPHYVPVLHSHVQSIHVTIGNEVGDNAQFQTGKTLVKLHFRPARNF